MAGVGGPQVEPTPVRAEVLDEGRAAVHGGHSLLKLVVLIDVPLVRPPPGLLHMTEPVVGDALILHELHLVENVVPCVVGLLGHHLLPLVDVVQKP